MSLASYETALPRATQLRMLANTTILQHINGLWSVNHAWSLSEGPEDCGA